MRAFFAALAQILKGLLGIVWAPFQFVGSMLSGGGGGSPQDQAALVAEHAANEEAAKHLELTANNPVTLDDVATVKRVCGRLLMGKSISSETKISSSLLSILTSAPRGVLKSLAEGDADTVTNYVDGYREGFMKASAARAAIPEAMVEVQFPRLAERVAAYKAARGTAEPSEVIPGSRRAAA